MEESSDYFPCVEESPGSYVKGHHGDIHELHRDNFSFVSSLDGSITTSGNLSEHSVDDIDQYDSGLRRTSYRLVRSSKSDLRINNSKNGSMNTMKSEASRHSNEVNIFGTTNDEEISIATSSSTSLSSDNAQSMGRSLMNASQYTLAFPILENAIYENQYDCPPSTYLNAIECGLKIKNFKSSLAIAQIFLKKFPDLPLPYYDLARCLKASNQIDAAIAVCSNGLQKFPSSDLLRSLRGKYHYENANYKQAVADFHKSIELSRRLEGAKASSEYALKPWLRSSQF
jgi:tetratricopeptide (TPR) repeat protein